MTWARYSPQLQKDLMGKNYKIIIGCSQFLLISITEKEKKTFKQHVYMKLNYPSNTSGSLENEIKIMILIK